MHKIQNTRGISFAGAWLKYGFHEDGFTSGLRAALAVSSTSMLVERDQFLTDSTFADDIHPPFEVKDADRPAEPALAASIFGILESTGASEVLGSVFGLMLDVFRAVLLAILAVFLGVTE